MTEMKFKNIKNLVDESREQDYVQAFMIDNNIIGVYKIDEDAQLPVYSTKNAACFDLRACLKFGNAIKLNDSEDDSHRTIQYDPDVTHRPYVTVKPGETALIPTGLVFDIPDVYSMRIHPRSGLALNHNIDLANSEGIVDSDYVEETMIMIRNQSRSKEYKIYHGDRVAQAEIVPVIRVNFIEFSEKPEQKTSRTGGFGSTGKR